METVREKVAFWLCPAAREREFFAALIRRFALRFGAPVFEPHVTLQGGDIDVGTALEALHAIPLPRFLQMEVERVAVSEEFTKTVFVQFRPSVEASRMSAAFGAAVGGNAGYHFNPHLSLIYKDMAESEKEELARSVDLPFKSVTFDSLQVIACPAEIRQRSDVEAWRKLGERTLVEGPR